MPRCSPCHPRCTRRRRPANSGDHRHRAPARGTHRGRAGLHHRLHGERNPSASIERPTDFIALTPGVSQVQTAEAGDLQVNIRGINTGRDAGNNFALVIDGVLQTNPNAAQPGARGRHADRSPQGSTGRALRSQRRCRRADPDHAQADRRVDFGGGGGLRLGQLVQGQRVLRRPARRSSNCGARSRPTRATPTASGKTSRTTATTASTSSRRRDSRAGCCSSLPAATWTSRRSIRNWSPRPIQLQQVGRAARRGGVPRRSGALRGPQPSQLPLHQQHQPRERAGERQRIAQGRLGHRVRDADQLRRLERPDQLLPDGRRERRVLPVRVRRHPPRDQRRELADPGYEPPFFGVPSSLWFTPAGGGAAGFLPPYGPRPAAATSTSSATRKTSASRSS